MMKFPVGSRVGQLSGDQIISRRCYIQSVQTGEAKKRPMTEPIDAKAEIKPDGKKLKAADAMEESRDPSTPMEQLMITNNDFNKCEKITLREEESKENEPWEERDSSVTAVFDPNTNSSVKPMMAEGSNQRSKTKDAIKILAQESIKEVASGEKGSTPKAMEN